VRIADKNSRQSKAAFVDKFTSRDHLQSLQSTACEGQAMTDTTIDRELTAEQEYALLGQLAKLANRAVTARVAGSNVSLHPDQAIALVECAEALKLISNAGYLGARMPGYATRALIKLESIL
jgi:hypothetical protein